MGLSIAYRVAHNLGYTKKPARLIPTYDHLGAHRKQNEAMRIATKRAGGGPLGTPPGKPFFTWGKDGRVSREPTTPYAGPRLLPAYKPQLSKVSMADWDKRGSWYKPDFRPKGMNPWTPMTTEELAAWHKKYPTPRYR